VKSTHLCIAVATGCILFFALVPDLRAQEALVPLPSGVPQDWTQRHIVYSHAALAEHPEIMEREPRVLHQELQRWHAPDRNGFHGVEPRAISATSPTRRDWSVNMGGRVPVDMFPSKYVFDPGLPPDCTRDYVVFGLASPNTPGATAPPANLVAFNNLYVNSGGTGFCGGAAPKVMFAYNITTVTGGRIKTSPVLSLDGTKIAFVESVQTAAPQTIFHVVTWAPGGTIAAPVVPTSMTSLAVSASADDSFGSPWVDYSSDTAYVATDDGKVYQIKPVFGGTPALTGGNWPIQVTNRIPSAPVLDSVLGKLLVGAQNGYLFQIDTASGTLGPKLQVGLTGSLNEPGIYAGPIIDITNGTAFVVSPNGVDKNGVATNSAVLVQVDIATMTEMSEATIGLGSSGGTHLRLYEPALDNNYYNGLPTGMIHLCGTSALDTSPWQYAFGFTAGTMNTIPTTAQSLLTSINARCTGWTEFFNPNKGVAGTDFFFFGLSQDCYPPGNLGTAFGCVEALSSDPTIPTAFAQINSGPTGIIIDNYSTDVGASSIYFTSNGKNTAYKFTQQGLQ
jgi:hypothetical protein